MQNRDPCAGTVRIVDSGMMTHLRYCRIYTQKGNDFTGE